MNTARFCVVRERRNLHDDKIIDIVVGEHEGRNVLVLHGGAFGDARWRGPL